MLGTEIVNWFDVPADCTWGMSARGDAPKMAARCVEALFHPQKRAHATIAFRQSN